MVDVDTFLTTLYVMVDDFCHSQPPKSKPGPEASLCESEVITLAIFARWSRFASERDFYRYAQSRLRDAFYRDPEAFLASQVGIFRKKRLRAWAEGWRTMVGRAVEVGPALFGSNYTEVRYEDLLERPDKEATRLFRFLGADASTEVVEECVEEASFEKGSGRQRGQDDYPLRHGKYRKGIAGDWKNVFIERDTEIFKETAGDLLIGLGYEKDNTW
jgi:Sulfotransferase domain